MEKSIKEKAVRAVNMAVYVGYHTNIKTDATFLWGLIDFGYSNEVRAMEGTTSLANIASFSMGGWEKQIDIDTVRLSKILVGNSEWDGFVKWESEIV